MGHHGVGDSRVRIEVHGRSHHRLHLLDDPPGHHLHHTIRICVNHSERLNDDDDDDVHSDPARCGVRAPADRNCVVAVRWPLFTPPATDGDLKSPSPRHLSLITPNRRPLSHESSRNSGPLGSDRRPPGWIWFGWTETLILPESHRKIRKDALEITLKSHTVLELVVDLAYMERDTHQWPSKSHRLGMPSRGGVYNRCSLIGVHVQSIIDFSMVFHPSWILIN